jgi:hypothetical protein
MIKGGRARGSKQKRENEEEVDNENERSEYDFLALGTVTNANQSPHKAVLTVENPMKRQSRSSSKSGECRVQWPFYGLPLDLGMPLFKLALRTNCTFFIQPRY